MSEYILMNKDERFMKLWIAVNHIEIREVYRDIPNWIDDINMWIESRLSISNRLNILNLEMMFNLGTIEKYVNLTKAVSSTDTLWIKRPNEQISWSQISPYRQIDDIIADIALNGRKGRKVDISNPLVKISPQYQLSGSISKCVRQCNILGKQGIYLYKTDGECWSDKAGKRPYSEYFVSEVSRILSLPSYVTYGIEERYNENNKIVPYCICEMFTNESIGLMECSDTIYNRKTIKEIISSLYNKRDKQLLKDMLILDSIVCNEDRHRGNYGFLINNDTLNIIGVAPIYDNDCSLGSLESIQGLNHSEAYRLLKKKHPKTMMGTYNEQALAVMDWGWYNKLKEIANRGGIRIAPAFKGLSSNRIDFMNYVINKRIDEIIKLVEKR